MDEDQVREIIRDELAKFVGPVLSAGVDALEGLGVLDGTLVGSIFGGFRDIFGSD